MATRLLNTMLVMGSLATLSLVSAHDWRGWLAGCLALGMLIALWVAARSFHRQLGAVHRLQAAQDQLDQQAKLIIRTDLELRRTQEELDQRLASLMSLHELGRQLQVSLRPDEILSKLDAATVSTFGFSQGLLGTCPSFDQLRWCSSFGIDDALADRVRTHLVQTGLLRHLLAQPSPELLDAASVDDPPRRRLLELLGASTVVVAAVIPNTGPAGCLLFGRSSGSPLNPRATRELIAVLVNQLAIAMENSSLYEDTWTSQRNLEDKVRARTHELAEANARLIQVNKAKTDFVSAVTHELRTPLAAIKGYASLLANKKFGGLLDAQQERLEKIERHADLLTQLINGLLDIARIESGRVAMNLERIAVGELLDIVHDLVRPQLEAKGLRYRVEPNGVTHLVGDSQQLQRVFVNLLSNAVKYTPEKGSIRLTLHQEGDTISIAVSDTGRGIATEELPKLFQEFYRASDPVNQQVRGTGLGLVLAKRIVEAHHGQIAVTSKVGEGSTFTVSLPAPSATPQRQSASG